MLSAVTTESAIRGDRLVFFGSGALSIGYAAPGAGKCGIEAAFIALTGGASLTAAGRLGATNTPVAATDWSRYLIKADVTQSGTNAVTVTAAEYLTNWALYHYVRFTASSANATSVTITFYGTPTAASTAAMSVTIPAASLVGNCDLTVTANANTKWVIAGLGAAAAPKTGDSSRPLLWLGLCLLAMLGFALISLVPGRPLLRSRPRMPK